MGILFALLAALFASTSNLFLRRSIDAGGSAKAYLVVQLSFSFFVMVLLNPVRTGDYGWSFPPFAWGLVGGVLFGLLMWGLGRTLEKGPPGLTFATLNSSSVMPGIMMALLFGATYGHPYSITTALGSVLVVLGLFWAGWTSAENPHKAFWIFFVSFIFVIHTLFLVFLQWWAMVLKPPLPTFALLPFHLPSISNQWFMPSIFLAGALFQWGVYFTQRQRMPYGVEIAYGIIGGVANGGCVFFQILAPQVAAPWENAMIFPVFSVTIIVLCNAWAQLLYKEQVNWLANGVCIAGLVIGTAL
ncbi:MAG: hypothetical protein K940chlam9_00841 [Chlamydiae bacterium]|nr:hypothetical protein [Chlamydiota bacterium]